MNNNQDDQSKVTESGNNNISLKRNELQDESIETHSQQTLDDPQVQKTPQYNLPDVKPQALHTEERTTEIKKEQNSQALKDLPMQEILNTVFLAPRSPEDEKIFKNIRNLITASQITAVISLFLGWVLLSIVSVVLGLVARSRADAMTKKYNDRTQENAWIMLKRSAGFAAAMGVLALCVNIFLLILIYPELISDLQNSGIDSILTSGGSSSSVSNVTGRSSTWG